MTVRLKETMSWFTLLVTSLSLLRPGFDLGSVYVRCVVDKLAMGQVFHRVFQFFPVIIILPTLHIHLHLSHFFSRLKNVTMLHKFLVLSTSFLSFAIYDQNFGPISVSLTQAS